MGECHPTHYFPNSSLVFTILSAILTPNGHLLSQPRQPTHADAVVPKHGVGEVVDHPSAAIGLADASEIYTIKKLAFAVNEQLKAFWASCGVTLVDFKLEFGKLADGSIVLADEISPDTCRLWDSATGEKLDKDRFRRDLGGVEDAYREIMKRLEEHISEA